jgi:hypothetical protein
MFGVCTVAPCNKTRITVTITTVLSNFRPMLRTCLVPIKVDFNLKSVNVIHFYQG